MADVNIDAPTGQAPAMAPPMHTDDQILPRIRWVPIGKSNCYLDLDKSQSNPIYKITLDEQWFVLTEDTLREALQITPVNNNQAFISPPSSDALINLVNELGYPKHTRGTTKPARMPKSTAPKAPSRPSVSTPVTSTQPKPTSAPAKPQIKKRKLTTKTSDKPSKAEKSKYGFVSKKRTLKSVAESVAEDAHAKEPQVSHDLLSLQKPKKKSPADQYIFQRLTSTPTGSFRHDESSYVELGQSDSEEESKKVVLRADAGGQAYIREKKATLIVILSIRFTKLIIHHLQRRHKFHPRPDSPLHLPNEEPVLGYLKFNAKGTKREVFRMPIPSSLITADIQEASYYQEYLANVAKHRRYLAGETGSDPDSPAPKTTKPARMPKSTAPKAPSRPSVSTPVTSTQPKPTSAPAKPQIKKRKLTTKTSDKPSKAEKSKYGFVSKKRTLKSVAESVAKDAHAKEPQVYAEDADMQKALEESLKSMYDVPRGSLPPVVIREPGHDESSYAELGQSDSEEESKKVVLRADAGGQGEGQDGPDPNAQAEGQTGPDAVAQDEGQAGSNPDKQSEG
nr:histone deacetylase 14 [Tanacetum cinerariifolium]